MRINRSAALICTLAVHNGSLRGTQSVFQALGHPPPSRDALVDFLDRAGRAATRLLLRAREGGAVVLVYGQARRQWAG